MLDSKSRSQDQVIDSIHLWWCLGSGASGGAWTRLEGRIRQCKKARLPDLMCDNWELLKPKRNWWRYFLPFRLSCEWLQKEDGRCAIYL